jgi:hypothetical protein
VLGYLYAPNLGLTNREVTNMTRKHFNRMAEILLEVQPEMNSEAYAHLVDRLGDWFCLDNQLFDRTRWETATNRDGE